MEEAKDALDSFIATARALYLEDGVSELSDGSLACVLSSRLGHKGKALEALAETLTWRRTFGTSKLLSKGEKFSVFRDTGCVQWFGKDLSGYPVLVFTGSRLIPPKNDSDIENMIRYFIHVLEDAIHAGILTTKMTVVVDRNGIKIDKNELKFLSTLVPILQKHYPDRLHSLYIFPTNTFFWMTWKVFKMYIDAKTIPKIQLKEKETILLEIISKENLFTRYGGSLIDPYDPIVEKESVQLEPPSTLKPPNSATSSSSNLSLEGMSDDPVKSSSKGAATPTMPLKKAPSASSKEILTPVSTTSADSPLMSPLPPLPNRRQAQANPARSRQESSNSVSFSFGKKNAVLPGPPTTEEVWVAPAEYQDI